MRYDGNPRFYFSLGKLQTNFRRGKALDFTFFQSIPRRLFFLVAAGIESERIDALEFNDVQLPNSELTLLFAVYQRLSLIAVCCTYKLLL